MSVSAILPEKVTVGPMAPTVEATEVTIITAQVIGTIHAPIIRVQAIVIILLIVIRAREVITLNLAIVSALVVVPGVDIIVTFPEDIQAVWLVD